MFGAGTAGTPFLAPDHQVVLERDRGDQQKRRQQHQPELTEHTDQQRARRRSDQPAHAGTSSDEGEQPARLWRVEYIGHQAPGDRDHEQVVDRDPHVEHPRQPDAVSEQEEQPREHEQVDAEKAVHPVDVMDARDPRVEPGEQWHRHQHGDEGRCEQPLQVLDATLNAHRLANRPQHEVPREQAEEQAEPGQRSTQFARAGIDQRGSSSG